MLRLFNRKKRLNRVKIISIILTLAVVACSHKLWTTSQDAVFSFEVAGKGNISYQVFFTEKSDQNFNEKMSIKQKSSANKITFKIDAKTIKMLRLDFDNDGTQLKFSSFVIGGHELNPNNIRTNGISAHSYKDGVLLVIPDLHDSYIVFKEPLNIKTPLRIDYSILIIVATLSFLLSYKVADYLADFKITKNHSRIDIVFLCFFFVIIFLPMLNISDAQNSKYENRRLATYKPFMEKHKINVNYGTNFESWFNDRFNGRNFLVKNNDNFLEFINGITGNDKVFLGAEDWMFYKGDDGIKNFQNLSEFSEERLKKIAEHLESINTWAIKNNKKFYYYIAPDKNKIYGEHIKNIRKAHQNSQSRTNKLIKYLQEHTSVNVIYPYDTLIEAKERGLLYFKNDTHWNYFGALIGYKELEKAIQKDFPNMEALQIKSYQNKANPKGDLTNMCPVVGEDKDTLYKKPIVSQNSVCKDVSKKNSKRFDYECKNNEKRDLNIVIYIDSFGLYFKDFVSNTFNNSSFYWQYEIDYTNPKVKEADIIVLQSVERFIPQILRKTNK